MAFYIFHRHRVCLVDHVDLICCLVQLVGRFCSFSLATLPLGLNCGFISTSACVSSTGVALEVVQWEELWRKTGQRGLLIASYKRLEKKTLIGP